MIDHKEPRIPYSIFKVVRYPNSIMLINKGLETVGQITIKDRFEEELWKEAIQMINRLQKEKES